MIERRELHIDGTWRTPHGRGTIEVIDAHTEAVMGVVPAGDAQDGMTASNVLAPFGGFTKSGLGRELGHHGLDEYGELLAMQLPAGTDAHEVADALRALS